MRGRIPVRGKGKFLQKQEKKGCNFFKRPDRRLKGIFNIKTAQNYRGKKGKMYNIDFDR